MNLKPLLAVFLVSASYFLGSIFFKGNTIYLFDVCWRLAIILGVILIGKFNPKLTKKQIGLLVILFFSEFAAFRFFSPQFPVWRIVISTVLAPVTEELLFRGWVINSISGTKKKKTVISSILFSLYHLKNANVLTPLALLYQMAFAGLVAGPILAWVRLRTDSVFGCLLLHSGNNTLGDGITPKLFPLLVQRKLNF